MFLRNWLISVSKNSANVPIDYDVIIYSHMINKENVSVLWVYQRFNKLAVELTFYSVYYYCVILNQKNYNEKPCT